MPSAFSRDGLRGGSRRQAFYIAVWVIVVIGALLIAAAQWRKGLVAFAGAIYLAGVARALLPPHLVGWLAVRNRTSDVIFCVIIGTALLLAAITATDITAA